jgi:hypothetical protein
MINVQKKSRLQNNSLYLYILTSAVVYMSNALQWAHGTQ